MRLIAVLALPLVLTAADEPENPPSPPLALDNPAYSTPIERWETLDDAIRAARVDEILGRANCADGVYEASETVEDTPEDNARVEQPVQTGRIFREPASPERPHLIYAVDHREGGCSLMVMKGNRADIRRLPRPVEEGEMLVPADTGQ